MVEECSLNPTLKVEECFYSLEEIEEKKQQKLMQVKMQLCDFIIFSLTFGRSSECQVKDYVFLVCLLETKFQVRLC